MSFENLRTKGWTDAEITHLQQHFHPQAENRTVVAFALILLLAAAVGVPFLYGLFGGVMTESIFWTVLLIIGVPLGAVFGVLLVDIDRLTRQHHILLLVAVPVAAAIGGAALIAQAEATVPGLAPHNALIGGLVYATAFIAPYAILVKREWNSRIGRWST